MAPREPLYRVSRRFRCPVCGKARWCRFTATHAMCMRVPSDRPTKGGGWLHPLDAEAQRAARQEIARRRLDPSPPPPTGRDTTAALLSLSESLLQHFNRHGFDTRRRYAAIWRDFMAFLGARGLVAHPKDVVPAHVRAYLESLRAAGRPERELAERLAVISELHARLPLHARRFQGRLRDALRPPVPRPGREAAALAYVEARLRRLREYSPSTRRQYGKAWRRFARWLADWEAADSDPVVALRRLARDPAVAETALAAYLEHRRSQGASPRALTAERSALRALLVQLSRSEKEEGGRGRAG